MITSIGILCALAGLSLGIVASRRSGSSRAFGFAASVVSSVLLALYIFMVL